ncbi:DUF4303 domain-containing protein [Leptospira mayottensis]|uniref:DUF4303 domain-containing protein n=1 Tax=Leptospira mayottensis TaxID=1137606 RepID=UPI000E359CFB|nr:DUF4303 domain-containing protein [Leptospira mayottensis]AXR67119.1 hypothetical protein DPV73_02940 [Leptospira mayottensis]
MAEDRDLLDELALVFSNYLLSLNNVKKIGCIGIGLSNPENITFFYCTRLWIDVRDDYQERVYETGIRLPEHLRTKTYEEILSFAEIFFAKVQKDKNLKMLALRKGFEFLLESEGAVGNVTLSSNLQIDLTTPAFDIAEMTKFAIQEIEKFSKDHEDEVFYAFAIDADLFCLNSISGFDKRLAEDRKLWPKSYETKEQVEKFKYNPGDWAYQGFAKLSEETGFVLDLYEKHYDAPKGEQKTSEYAQAMNSLMISLEKRNAFADLRKTDDFRIFRVEHNY